MFTVRAKLASLSRNISYFHNPGKQPLKYTTVGELLETTATKHSDTKAVISRHQNQSLTFSELLEKADKFASGLRSLGLKKNDRVGIWAPNLIEWYVTNMACARAGFITVCLNPAYESGEIEYCINKVGMKAIVCGDKFKNHWFYNSLVKLVPDLKSKEISSPKIPSLRTIVVMSNASTNSGTYSFDEVLSLASGTNHNVTPEDLCNILFTSGTTGQPKATVVSHFALVNNSFLIGKKLGLGRDNICVQVPFFHAFGSVVGIMAALNYGSTLVLPSDGYNADKSLDAIKQEKCSIVYGTPTMFIDLMEAQSRRQEEISVDVAFVAAALSAPDLRRKIREELNIKKIVSGYGTTECTGVVFQSVPDEAEDKVMSTVGCVNEHVEVRVVDEEGVVPFGTPGELHIRTYSNMLGYWNDENSTKEVLSSDGWYRTGDQFILEKDGYGAVVGRLKEMIIRGGENIFPREIEEFLFTHPDILDVHVVGLPHQRLGEEVCACIKVRPGKTLTQEDVVGFCEGKLARFKIPSTVKFVEEFPKTASGKVQKFKLREMVLRGLL